MPVVSPADSSIVAISFGVIVLCYFVPTFIAYARRHPKRRTIFLLDLLAGWTVIGWVIAGVWSSIPDMEAGGGPAGALEKFPERRKLAS